jgi:hypothetical protein
VLRTRRCSCVLQMAFLQYRDVLEASAGSLGIYLLTDGKPDTSMSMVLNEVRQMNSNKNIVINTISFNCPDRYHYCLLSFQYTLFLNTIIVKSMAW